MLEKKSVPCALLLFTLMIELQVVLKSSKTSSYELNWCPFHSFYVTGCTHARPIQGISSISCSFKSLVLLYCGLCCSENEGALVVMSLQGALDLGVGSPSAKYLFAVLGKTSRSISYSP